MTGGVKVRWAKRESSATRMTGTMRMSRVGENATASRKEVRKMMKVKATRRKARRTKRWKVERTRRMKMNLV